MGKKPFFFRLLLTSLLMACISVLTNAQTESFSVSAQPDSSLMVIGGQMNLTLEVSQPPNLIVAFPQFTDTITKNIEIVEAFPRDTTVASDNYLSIKQVYRITSFDSGLHYIPPMAFELASEQMKEKRTTRPIGIMVVNPFEEVDPQKGITDIKQPIDTPFSLAELLRFLPWIVGGLLMGLLLTGLIYWLVYRKNPLKVILKEKPKEPAHVIALRQLEKIKKEKIWQKGQIKRFYSDVTDTLRRYLENRYGIDAPEQTTAEILQSLRQVELPDEQVAKKIKQVLELADLVKFARFEPLPDEHDLTLINAYFFVNQTRYEELKTTEEMAKEMQTQESAQHVES